MKAFYPKEQVIIAPGEYEGNEEISFSFSVEYFEDKLLLNGAEVPIDYSNRPDTKNRLKLAVYNYLQKRTGTDLPWGTLTGIRPTKISLKMIMDGATDQEIRDYMKSTYLTSDEKTELCLQVSHHEHEILKKIDYDNGYSLYIGIPFCPSTCLYCSFTSYPYAAYRKWVDDYLKCLEKEMEYTSKAFSKKTLDTLYIGGGTPTSLDEEHLAVLLDTIDRYFDTKNLKEYTIEAGRPDSITREKLGIIKSHPITRISVNPQTMNDKTLKLIGRHHTVDDIVKVMAWAREYDFQNINMDLILGLPGETIEDVQYTLQEVSKLKPDSLTIHSLALKHSSKLNIDKEAYDDYLIENSQAHMDAAEKAAKNLGLEAYYLYRQKNIAANLENIGYSALGKEGIYNILIMEEIQDIVALGAGTSCKKILPDKSTARCENVKDVQLYIERIDEMIDRKRQLFGVDN